MDSDRAGESTDGSGAEESQGIPAGSGNPGEDYIDAINWWPDYPLTDEERAYLQADIEAERRKDIAWAALYEARRAVGTGQGPETTSPETG